MSEPQQGNFLANTIKTNPLIVASILLLINFLLRIFIWSNTELFRFADYSAYLGGVDKLVRGEHQYLLEGNFLFAISYIGYFCENFLGSLDYFFVFNCLIASLTGLILYFLVIKFTGMVLAGIITVVIQTLYTEYMVFSSVFYSPVIMIFMLSLFLLIICLYLDSKKRNQTTAYLILLILIFLLTFFFKPELKYLPWFLLVPGLIFFKKSRSYSKKLLILSFLLFPFSFLIQHSNIITHPEGNVISNSFVFFGHTDYGGNGGEGSFVYPYNKARYEAVLAEYCNANNISNPTVSDYNSFQRKEMKNFITHHPLKWVSLQFTKFFRTFGVVPETTSFKILYTGLFKENLWLTSIVVVAPIVLIVLLFITFFNYSSIKKLLNPSTFIRRSFSEGGLSIPSTLQHNSANHPPHATRPNNYILYVYLLFFIYYLIATIFYGQYQERYRMPLMVVFIIPAIGYFIASFNKEQLHKKSSLIIKSAVIVLFLTVWVFQAKKAISNKERLENAIESVIGNQCNQ